MLNLEVLARTYGYPAVALGTILQGEVMLLICGFLAHQGYLSVWIVWLLGASGGTGGDQIYFWLGRTFGDRVIARLPRPLRASANTARRLVEHHPRVVLMYMRFLFGMRIALPVLVGASTIPAGRFVRYNLITAALWSAIFVSVGYAFGAAAEIYLRRFEGVEFILVGVLIVAGVVYQMVAGRLHERWHAEDEMKNEK